MKKINLVLGTMTFGESVFHPEVEAFVKAFLDAGYEELDTAYVYNEGRCEILLGEALQGIQGYKISTKVNPRISGRLDGKAAYTQLNESLARLGMDCVDIFYLHFPDAERRWIRFWRPARSFTGRGNSGSWAFPISGVADGRCMA